MFSTDFRKIFKYQISRKSLQWEPNFSTRTDGMTDLKKLRAAFRSFSKASIKNAHISSHSALHMCGADGVHVQNLGVDGLY